MRLTCPVSLQSASLCQVRGLSLEAPVWIIHLCMQAGIPSTTWATIINISNQSWQFLKGICSQIASTHSCLVPSQFIYYGVYVQYLLKMNPSFGLSRFWTSVKIEIFQQILEGFLNIRIDLQTVNTFSPTIPVQIQM